MVVMFRSGGFLLRALSALLPTILDGLRIVDTYPDLEWTRIIRYLKAQSMYYHQKYKRGYTDETLERSLAALSESWDEFAFWWNGRLDCDGVFFHHLRLSNVEADDTMKVAVGMARSASKLLLRTLPPRGEKGKWTKTAPGFDWFVRLAMPNKLIRPLVEAAGQLITTFVENFDGNWSKLSFSESQSVRWNKTKELLGDQTTIFFIRSLLAML